MVAHAEFSTSEVAVAPGESRDFELALTNLASTAEMFTLVPSGLLAGWVQITPPTVSLEAGARHKVVVTLHPPRLATTPAGAAPLTVRIIPHDEPDDVILAETIAILDAFHDRRVQLLQPVVRSRRRAVCEFLVENHGNSQASCRLHLIDTSRRLDGDFDPPAVGVEPGGNSLVRLRMKAVRRQWRRGSRTIPFSIEADQQGFPTAAGTATFVQTPILPERFGRRLLALALIAGLLTGAWFAFLKPLTERTARDAVADQPDPVVVTIVNGDATAADSDVNAGDQEPLSTAVPTPAPQTTAVPVAVADPGTGFNKRFVVTTQVGTTQRDQYAVPPGKELRITDVILQNVNGDGGLATFSANDAPQQQWDLSTSIDNIDPLNLFSPLVFRAGTVLTFQVECQTSGVSTGVCTQGLLVSGLEFDAQEGR